MEEIRERIGGLGRRELVGLVLIGALIVGGAVFWYVRSLPAPIRVEASSAPIRPAGGGSAVPSSPTPSPAVLVVYVTGWVVHPGVYDFSDGDRVIDAIDRAGGVRSGADLAGINLAARLADGMQITVGRRGQPGSAGIGSGAGSAGSGGAGADRNAGVNINSATLDQLDSLPGIGPALAQRIVDYREQHGPFHSIEELMKVSGIGPKKFAQLQSRITV